MLRGDEMAQTMDRLQRSAALLAILGMFLLAGCGNAPTGTAVAVLPNGISAPTATWTRTDTATPVRRATPSPTATPLPSCGVDAFQDYQRLLCAPAEVTEGKVQSEWLRWCLGHYGYALTEPAAAELPLVTASLPDGQCTYQAIRVDGAELPYVGGVLYVAVGIEGAGVSTVTPTATATPIPMIQVGNLSVPDPRYSNLELFDLSKPDAPIPEFVSAMKIAGVELSLEQVVKGMTFDAMEDVRGRQLVVAVATIPDHALEDLGGDYPLTIATQNELGKWRWEVFEWYHASQVTGILLGMGIDLGDPNQSEAGYKGAFTQSRLPWITGGLMHVSIDWGRQFVPLVMREFRQRHPGREVSIGMSHMFWHHDAFPHELTDSSIALERRKELGRQYLRDRVREVIRILKPYLLDGSIDRVVASFANEVVWEYNGGTGWEGEYSDYPLYDLLGARWVTEAYVALEEVIREEGLSRNQFVAILNAGGIEIPSLLGNYYREQRRLIVRQIAEALGIPEGEVQLDVGIQFGMGYGNLYGGKAYIDKVLGMMKTVQGRQAISQHFALLSGEGGGIWITELSAAGTDEEVACFVAQLAWILEDQQIKLKGINVWSPLRRPDAYSGDAIFDKSSYQPRAGYYILERLVLEKARQ